MTATDYRESGSFEKAFLKTLGFEGGYSLDPDDPGGETKYGVSKAQYPNVNIKELSLDGAFEIYWRDYWMPLQLEALDNWDLAAEVFDTGVNQGKENAAMTLQGALTLLGSPLVVDGRVGPKTIAAANAYRHGDALIKLMNVFQGMLYLLGAANVEEVVQMIRARGAHVKRYLRGWLSRVQI